MEDIRRLDRRLFLRELLSPWRIILSLVGFAIVFGQLSAASVSDVGVMLGGAALVAVVAGATAYSASIKKRFTNRRHESLWNGCQDRLARFEEVLKRMRRDEIADLREMPKTIRGVAQSLYCALRRSDVISTEVQETERGLYGQPPVWSAQAHDPQSKELYRIADKNIAEYRQHFAGVMAGVQRTEAQSAVFMTTLDTLRMKMLGYRLVGRSPEMHSQDFLEALAEAKLQLQSIDQALEELDLGVYPKQISVVPPPIPDDIRETLGQG
jgi:hypothetical protein